MSPILTVQQLAEALSLNDETIRRLTRSGELPHHLIGGSIRYTLADVLAKTAVNKHPDDEAIDVFAAAMHAKMTKARAEGREGWDNPDRCSLMHLTDRLRKSAEGLDWVSVANYAMMLHMRGGK